MSDQIASYTFLPWVRQGMASQITTDDNLGRVDEDPQGNEPQPLERASVRISLQVNGDPEFVAKEVQVIGPGDVIGINPQAIVRTDPRNWVTDFEPNYLTFMEFYDEDFPWRYTPARAVQRGAAGEPVGDVRQTKLRTWLQVLALEQGEFEECPPSGPLPAIRLSVDPDTLLPPADQSWAWAHVHVSQDITAAGANTPTESVDALQAAVRQNPDQALSRLICPRKLKPSRAYHAFLIPAFEVGRLAGLGRPTTGVDALLPSWGAEQDEYPVYYRWYFRTGERGDFEFLVNLLEPREVDGRVGIRDMDMQKPNFGVTGMSTGPGDLSVMGLEGALKSPQALPWPAVWPPENRSEYPAFLNDLEKMVNLNETLHEEEIEDVQVTLLNLPGTAASHPDPIISPPLYGRWHGLQTGLEVGQEGWVNELNQDPRLRVPAGFGTKVVQTGQEGYMQRAWQQLGDILRANQKIRQVQVSIAASMRVYNRHFILLEPDQQIAVTRQVHARVMGSPTTVYQELRESRLEAAALSPAGRRLLRPRGVFMRKALPESQGRPTDVLVKLNLGRVTAARPKQPPAKQISLSRTADALQISELRESNLTADSVRRIPARRDFRVSLPDRLAPPFSSPADRESPEGGTFRAAAEELHARLETPLPAPAPRQRADIGGLGSTLARALNPKSAILQRALSTISIPNTFHYLRSTETIVPIMAHPVFADPMYKPLSALSSEMLIPNLDLIPNNTITLLETNPRFIEAYMVGLNHEMARELLWREFLTDQRGSYFRQFWDPGEVVNRDPDKDAKTLEEELRDIKPLHMWKRGTALGSHENRNLPTGAEPGEKRLVLVIRGDLLKKYPTAVILAQRAMWVDDPEDTTPPRRKIRVLDDGDPATTMRPPIFKAQIEPDLDFLGFDLTASQAKGEPEFPGNPGWFFVIQERPGEPRFGLDILEKDEPRPPIDVWNKLSWNHLGDPDAIPFIDLEPAEIPEATDSPDSAIEWGSNAADMAYILFQVPVMVAIHADNMLK